MPRKRVTTGPRSSRGPRPAAQFHEEPEPAAPPVEEELQPEEHPPQPPAEEAYPAPPPALLAKFAGRKITKGRKIDFKFLEEEGFTIGHLIRLQGWEFLCSLNERTYPGLVHEFYAGLKIGSDGLILDVRGKRISLSEQILGELLHLPTAGIVPGKLDNRIASLKLVLQTDAVCDIGELIASTLPAEMRLLHSFIGRILFPKNGRFDYVSERELAIMEHMIHGRPLNLPAMMLQQMRTAAARQKASLPYGMVLTVIFRAHGVSFEGEQFQYLLHTDYYTASTLHRMGYVKSDGLWIKKDEDPRPAPAPAPAPAPTASAPGPSIPATDAEPSLPSSPAHVPAPPAEPSSHIESEILRAVEDMGARLSSQIDQLRETLMGRLDQLEARLSAQTAVPPAQQDSASSAPPAPAQPSPPHQAVLSGIPPRPPRQSAPTGPASRTRSQARSRSPGASIASVPMPPTDQSLRVYSRVIRRRSQH